MVSQRWSVDSYKNKSVNGKPSGQIPVGYSMYIDNPTDYLLEDGGNNNFQITPMNSAGGTSAICSLIQEESGEQIDINIYTPETKIENDILVTIRPDKYEVIANLEISARHRVASDINFSMVIKYGVSPGDTITRETTLNRGDSYTTETVDIQKEATPLILSGDYWPKEDDKYKYIVSFM